MIRVATRSPAGGGETEICIAMLQKLPPATGALVPIVSLGLNERTATSCAWQAGEEGGPYGLDLFGAGGGVRLAFDERKQELSLSGNVTYSADGTHFLATPWAPRSCAQKNTAFLTRNVVGARREHRGIYVVVHDLGQKIPPYNV